MTEIESHLFEALKELQATYDQHQKSWEESYNSLQVMFTVTKESNEEIKRMLEVTLNDNTRLLKSVLDDNTHTKAEIARLEKQLILFREHLKK